MTRITDLSLYDMIVICHWNLNQPERVCGLWDDTVNPCPSSGAYVCFLTLRISCLLPSPLKLVVAAPIAVEPIDMKGACPP